jgi:hypothetical protein
MRPSPRSRSRSATVGGRACIVALAAGLAVMGASRQAAAQACCAGGAVVTPTRLALHEDFALGLQLRARTDGGSFDPQGTYARTGGDRIFEQDLAGSFRFAGRGQAGALLPLIETHRTAGGLADTGGGLGDLALNARYDLLLASEALYLPGFGVLAAATLPTGRPSDQATPPLLTDATGAGTYDVTIGADVEKVAGHVYVALDAWVTHRFARTLTVTAPGTPATTIHESFSARLTLLAVAGYVFDGEAALGAYVSLMNEGTATVDGVEDPTTRLRLTTVGLAGVLPVRDRWRLQGSVFSDLRWNDLGRNEPAGLGLTASVVWVWL